MPVLTSARTHGSAGPSPAAVAAYAGDGVELQTVTLGLRPVSGAARWTVTGEGAGRSLVFTAKPDGSDLEPVN